MMKRFYLSALSLLLSVSICLAQVVGGGVFGADKPLTSGVNYMSTVFMLKAGSATPITNTATSYLSIVPGSFNSSTNALATNRAVSVPAPGNIHHLHVYFPTALNSGDPSAIYTVNVLVGPNLTFPASTLGCQITSAALFCDNTAQISIYQGDLIVIQVVPTAGTSAPTSQTTGTPIISFIFTSNEGQYSFVCTGPMPSAPATGAINWTAPGSLAGWQALDATGFVDSLAFAVLPTAGTFDRMYVYTANAGVSVNTDYKVSAFQNGADTTLVATVDNAHGVGPFSDTTHSVTFANLDTVSIKSCPSATSALGATNCDGGGSFGAPSSRSVSACMRWHPTTTNQFLVLDSQTSPPGPSAPLTLLGNFSGTWSNIAATSQVFAYDGVPTLGGKTLTYGGFLAIQDLAPSTGTRTVEPFVGSTWNSTAQCGSVVASIGPSSSITVGGSLASYGAQDNTHTCLPTDNQFMMISESSTATQTTIHWFKTSAWGTLQ